MNQHFNFEVKKIIQTSDICRRNLNLIFFLHFPAKTGTLWWNRFCVGDRFYLMDNKILCEYDYEERLIFASMHNSAAAQIQRRVTDIPVRLFKRTGGGGHCYHYPLFQLRTRCIFSYTCPAICKFSTRMSSLACCLQF